jgi:ectoine hydroxylase-related dioxygenase (phytanoyl-CoA dioxygenase family)
MTEPVFDCDQVSGAELLDAVTRQGAALIRNAIDHEAIAGMLARADEVYAAWESKYERGELNAGDRQVFETGHVVPAAVDREGESFSVILFLVRSRLSRVLSTLWDGNLIFLGTNCVPRRQQPGGSINVAVPFHQDASFVGTWGLVLNFWIPLVACGRDAPGLEVVLDPPPGLIARDAPFDLTRTDYSGMDLPEQEVIAKYGAAKLWHPQMEAGDVLVFSSLAIHRTYETADMTRTRTSLEVRCADGANPKLPVERGDLVPVRLSAKQTSG